MSLIEDLKAAAHSLDQQFQVTSNELPGVLSALVYHLEHPNDFLKAAEDGGIEAVTELLQPKPPETPAEPTDPTAPAAAGPIDVSSLTDAERSDLWDRLAARRATDQQTTVTHEEGAPPSDAAPPPDAGFPG